MSTSIQSERLSILPIVFEDIYSLYDKQTRAFWLPSEIDLSNAKSDFDTLRASEKVFVKRVLSFLAVSDSLVQRNLNNNFTHEFKAPEVQACLSFQAAMESVHALSYSQQLNSICSSDEEQKALIDEVEKSTYVGAKIEFCRKYMKADKVHLATRVFGFILVEGVFFSSSFAAFAYMKSKNKMKGIGMANEFISRDEGMHCKTGIALLKNMAEEAKCSINHLVPGWKGILEEALSIETTYCDYVLPDGVILGLPVKQLKDHVQLCAEVIISMTGLKYDFAPRTTDKLASVGIANLQGKTNFFEARVSEYQKATQKDIREDAFDCQDF
jgi:ribonucleotide reductase beta subunit family protein with ferritin-like domain